MPLRRYIIIITISAIAAWLSWGLAVYYISPTEISNLSPIIFYITLFLSLIFTLALLGLLARIKIFKKEPIFRQANISLRQSLWFAAIIVFSLFLKAKNSFNWLNILFFLIIIAVIEFMCLAHKTTISKKS